VTEPGPRERSSVGLFGSLRSAFGHLIELVHTRLELASVEVEARLQVAVQLLLWSVVAFFSAALALLMLTLTLLIVFWDTHRLLAAGAITAFFAILAIAATLVVRYRLRTRTLLLAATINELKRDVAALDGPG
jgi:uncharacterized membrane protein YqjE